VPSAEAVIRSAVAVKLAGVLQVRVIVLLHVEAIVETLVMIQIATVTIQHAPVRRLTVEPVGYRTTETEERADL